MKTMPLVYAGSLMLASVLSAGCSKSDAPDPKQDNYGAPISPKKRVTPNPGNKSGGGKGQSLTQEG